MASSSRRPSVKGKKRAQARTAQAEGQNAAAEEAARSDVRPEQNPAAASGAQSVPSAPVVSSAPGASAVPAAPVAKESATLAARGASSSSKGEEPADFFDLGELDDNPPVKKRSARRASVAAKSGKRSFAHKTPKESPTENSEPPRFAPRQGQRPASSADSAAQRPARSASRKATEREKAIVRGRKRKAAWAVAFSAFAIVVVTSGLLFWNAYLRFDDAADLRGEWQVSDASMTMVIDASSIKMPDALVYEYELDTWEKTISFSFEDLSGKGTYRFSSDRKGVAIQEGEGENASVVTLVKVSDDESAEPHKGPAQVDESVDGQGLADTDGSSEVDDRKQAEQQDAAPEASGSAGEVADEAA